MRVAGVMSGTSLDGIDVAIVEIRGRRMETVGFQSTPYPDSVRAAILAVSGGAGHRFLWPANADDEKRSSAPLNPTREISRLNFQLGELYARAVLRAVRRFGPVDLIGCHGQTIYHEGSAHTLQIGEAAVVAERTGVPVVSNFRARDIAAGGQGAPLVPYVDYLLFRHSKRARIALNIGGIANITVIPAGAPPEDVIAFDTGPGNMVIDALTREYSQGKLNYDRGGKIAESGRVDRGLLDDLLADPYYRRKPPRSAGREQYGAEFVARMKASGLPLRDLIATATVLTSATIAMAVVGKTPISVNLRPISIRGASRQACRVGSRADFSKAETTLGPAGVDARATVCLETDLKLAPMGQTPWSARVPPDPQADHKTSSRPAWESAADHWVRPTETDLIVSGGGAHNPQLMAHLAGFLPEIMVSTSADHGINVDAKEAIAFAILAHETWRGKPSSLPSATGARRAVVLGDITP